MKHWCLVWCEIYPVQKLLLKMHLQCKWGFKIPQSQLTQIYTIITITTDSGKHGMTESSAECSAELFSKTSEMVPNGLNIPMYES